MFTYSGFFWFRIFDGSFMFCKTKCVLQCVAEHKRAVKNAEPEKSAVCEHLMLFDHRINWEESTVLKYVNSYCRW